MHKLLMLYTPATGLPQLFWETLCAFLVSYRIKGTGLGAFASPGETSSWLLLPKRHLLCILFTRRKEALSLVNFHRAVGRLHVSFWPHVEKGSYMLSVPRRLVCLPQRPPCWGDKLVRGGEGLARRGVGVVVGVWESRKKDLELSETWKRS